MNGKVPSLEIRRNNNNLAAQQEDEGASLPSIKSPPSKSSTGISAPKHPPGRPPSAVVRMRSRSVTTATLSDAEVNYIMSASTPAFPTSPEVAPKQRSASKLKPSGSE